MSKYFEINEATKTFYTTNYKPENIIEAWRKTFEKWRLRGMGYSLIYPPLLRYESTYPQMLRGRNLDIESCGLCNLFFIENDDDLQYMCIYCPIGQKFPACKKTPCVEYLAEFYIGLKPSSHQVMRNLAWKEYLFLLKIYTKTCVKP